MTEDECEGKWYEQSLNAKVLLGVLPDEEPRFHDCVLEGVPKTPRCRTTVAISWFWARKQARDNGVSINAILKDHHCDANASIDRNMKQFPSKVSANLGQKCHLYSHFHDRVYDFEDL